MSNKKLKSFDSKCMLFVWRIKLLLKKSSQNFYHTFRAKWSYCFYSFSSKFKILNLKTFFFHFCIVRRSVQFAKLDRRKIISLVNWKLKIENTKLDFWIQTFASIDIQLQRETISRICQWSSYDYLIVVCKYSQTCVQRPPLGPEKRRRCAEGCL